MADVAVVTDSTCCLPGALLDRLEITVVSQYFDVGGGASPEGGHEVPGRGLRESEWDGDFGRFFAELDASRTIATTSPPTIEDFVAVYERLLQRHSAVVSVLISASLNPTCSIAREAAARLNSRSGSERVVVIDSAGVAGHLGVQALAGAQAAAAGEAASGVIAAVRRARQEVRQWFVVDTLEYLRRGGRIGGAAAWLGSALDLKPILMIESELKAVERVRTRKRAIERLVELMRQRRAVGVDQWFVTHTYAREDAKRLAQRLAELFGTEPLFISEVGPVIATHTGPGTVSAGGLPKAALEGAHG